MCVCKYCNLVRSFWYETYYIAIGWDVLVFLCLHPLQLT